MNKNYKTGKEELRWKKLSPYIDYLKCRIESAMPERLPATVLYREVLENGYNGKIRQLRYYVSQCYAQKKEDPILRYETAPGKQLQVDWIEFRKGKDRLSAFVATMGYSRASYVEFVTDEKIETFIKCHENAFHYLGGVAQQILYDNMKTVVIERNAYGEGKHRFQQGFWDFAKHYSFIPKLCRPYRAVTKGKVERFNRYLRYSFYLPLMSQLKLSGIKLDKAHANREVRVWLDNEANQRCHGTRGKIPFEELLIEQCFMMNLPLPYTGKLGKALEVLCQENKAKIQLPQVCKEIIFIPRPLSVYDRLLQEEAMA